ncbi:unnamed protein product [Diamesa serratosioi]
MDNIINENVNTIDKENKPKASGFPDKSEKKVSFSDNEESPMEVMNDDKKIAMSKISDSELDKTGILKKEVSENDITESKDVMPDSKSANENADGSKKVETKNQNKSLMELEVKRDKMRWLYMSELGSMFGSERQTREGFIKIFGDQAFLRNFFRLFDLENDNHLKQDLWIENIKGRLIDEKQIDFAEQIESVAYVICGENLVTFDKFCLIWNAKGILDKLYRLIDSEMTNNVSTTQIIEFVSNLTNSRPRGGFDKGSLERLEQLFRKTVGNGTEIKREDFKKIVISKNPFFNERVFQIFDKDNSGSISLQEFIDAMHQFAGQSTDNKIKFLFKVYDLDGDGLIQQQELQHVMRACMDENGMKFSDEQIDDLTKAMFEDADPLNTGTLTYEALQNQLTKHGGLLENLSISIDRWLVPVPQEPHKHKKLTKNSLSHKLTASYFKNNKIFLSFLLVFVIVNLVLFISRAIQYRKYNFLTIFARACGQCLNFNSAWVLVLMLRQSLTFLRTRGFGAVLPLDQHIYLHKLTGVLIAAFSLWHTAMHLLNFSKCFTIFHLYTLYVINTLLIPLDFVVVNDPIINSGNFTAAEWLFTSKPKLFGLIAGYANPTGLVLAFIILIMFVCSLPFVRRGGSFEVFYWTHLLYIPFWILLIFHGPNFWKWFIIPGTIFVFERLMRFIWMKSNRGKTYISSGILLPSKVTWLVIKRPFHFCFRPGDYVFINIPAIAKFEWHPFTLSSSPEQDDYIWLHIRAVGEWTNRLHDFFEKEQQRLENGGAALEASGSSIQLATNIISNMDYKAQIENMNEKMESTSTEPNQLAKIKALRECPRSESERSFDELEIKKAHYQSLGLPNMSPQNKSLAQSFRYMRNKPTIIAFKTPSLESYEASESNFDSIETGKPITNDAEEGKKRFNENSMNPLSFPVGKPLEIYIDGSYGAPSSHIFAAQHAVLIGTGIGVTPFASILQSIMHRYWKARHTCPNCEYEWSSNIPLTVMNLRKVDFFWINRDQRSFEWFVNLLSQLEIEQAELGGAMERFLDMHMYITSALQKTDMKAVSLQLALDLLAEKEKRDLITGLKTRTIAGRPNWDKVFKKIQDQKKGKVTVFYCGPVALAKTLRYKCEQFGFMFRKEIF